jgi:hypothetical protein
LATKQFYREKTGKTCPKDQVGLKVSCVNQLFERSLGLWHAEQMGLLEQFDDPIVVATQALQDQSVVVGGSAIVHFDFMVQSIKELLLVLWAELVPHGHPAAVNEIAVGIGLLDHEKDLKGLIVSPDGQGLLRCV